MIRHDPLAQLAKGGFFIRDLKLRALDGPPPKTMPIDYFFWKDFL